ncbi:MAG: response regulator [Planctomycetota bacterium]|nr:response regulator [Planctomycetota bacterium]
MAFRGLKILVVDDDVHSLASIGDFLERDGHSIRMARCGWEAVDIVRRLRREKWHFELSILDFHVPDLSGIEIFQRLSLLDPGLGAIFVSGDSSDSMEDSIQQAGGFALCPKPLDLGGLRRLIEAYERTRLLQ